MGELALMVAMQLVVNVLLSGAALFFAGFCVRLGWALGGWLTGRLSSG